jgi:hypothetical protein
LRLAYSDEEIGNALFQIGPLKAPGKDGFPARFYQRHWGIFKEDITAAVKEFFRSGKMPEGINDTIIVLIPKKKNPVCLRDFRPISLCNVIYKVVSKCMVNRLRPLLQEIIAPNQSAFIPGRLITDNALIAFECIHSLQKSTDGKGKFCGYKLDLAKAYDRVDWKYLQDILTKLGFANQWVDWVMCCVKTVTYSVRFNGTLLENFTPTRGLRQGDPLSPYLFLFVADGLSRLLQKEIDAGKIKELKVCRRSPGISHLLFADDSLLFFEANDDQANKVKTVLNKYEQATGQLLSPNKCSLLLGNKCSEATGQMVASILDVPTVGFEEKYLGLPVPEGRMKDGKFQPIKEKLKKRFSDYAEKYSSSGAKDVLIKSVVQSMYTYPMSVFKFSEGLCEELMKMTRDFWWGDENERRKMHWMRWDKVTRRKGQGGMGFRDLHLFNQALLARQAWRLIAYPNSLCARLLKAKYFPSSELTDTAFIKNPSPCWQGIMHGLELLKKGVVWRIGNGEQVRIWRDNWIPRGDMKITANLTKSRLRRVSDLINQEDHTWKEDTVRKIFMPHDAEEVLKIRLPRYEQEDFISWTYEKHGLFTVRSAYNLALDLRNNIPTNSSGNLNGDRSLWKTIWSSKMPPKVKIFTWKLATNSLAVQVNRSRRLPNVLPTCTICGMEAETSYHATMSCTRAKALREGMNQVWNLPHEKELVYTGNEWVLVLLNNINQEMRDKLMFIWWRAWHHRNNVIFGDGKASIQNSISYLQNYLATLQNYLATCRTWRWRAWHHKNNVIFGDGKASI